MSKRREDWVAEREKLFERLERMRKIGDYGAGAHDTRENAEVLLKLVDQTLERMK